MHPIFRVACSRKAHGAQRARRSAWLTAELLVASYSYFELGNPKGPAEYLRGIGPHEVTAVQHEFCFFCFLTNFVRSAATQPPKAVPEAGTRCYKPFSICPKSPRAPRRVLSAFWLRL